MQVKYLLHTVTVLRYNIVRSEVYVLRAWWIGGYPAGGCGYPAYPVGGCGIGGGFALIVVLFILLIHYRCKLVLLIDEKKADSK